MNKIYNLIKTGYQPIKQVAFEQNLSFPILYKGLRKEIWNKYNNSKEILHC